MDVVFYDGVLPWILSCRGEALLSCRGEALRSCRGEGFRSRIYGLGFGVEVHIVLCDCVVQRAPVGSGFGVKGWGVAGGGGRGELAVVGK